MLVFMKGVSIVQETQNWIFLPEGGGDGGWPWLDCSWGGVGKELEEKLVNLPFQRCEWDEGTN